MMFAPGLVPAIFFWKSVMRPTVPARARASERRICSKPCDLSRDRGGGSKTPRSARFWTERANYAKAGGSRGFPPIRKMELRAAGERRACLRPPKRSANIIRHDPALTFIKRAQPDVEISWHG